MVEPSKRAARLNLSYLLLPAVLALVAAVALAVSSASADHAGPHVRLVPTDDPSRDLSDPATPLTVFVGDTVSVDAMVEFPSSTDDLYAAEFHLDINAAGVLVGIDGESETPGFQVALSGDGLALTNKERLRTTIVGFPEDGDELRGCNFDPTPPPGNDSIYTFIKGGIGDDTNVLLQLLNQHQRPEWGEGWCGPTAVGISLAWFAETLSGDAANLIPHTGSTITVEDKYDAIATLGMLMNTSSGDGTTDNNLVDGIESYISSVGLAGEFVIKVFNHPTFLDYANELRTGDEDVLLRIISGDGRAHWLVGRSFSDVLETGGTPDTGDDYYPASFVDPGTASVYHSRVRRFGPAVLYSGDWMGFDLMVSVSPSDLPANESTAQYFVARNDFIASFVDTHIRSSGDLIFTLLGDPDPANVVNHRTLPLMGDENGRVFVARLTLMALNPGMATISFFNPLPASGSAIKLVRIAANDDAVLIPDVLFGTPAAVIQVISSELEVMVKLQGPNRLDPKGYEMPLEVRLFQRGPGDTDADVLNDAPVAIYGCAKMTRGAGDDQTPRGVCVVTVDRVGTFDVAVKSARTLLSVMRSAQVPGTLDFIGPAHDPEDAKGLHEGDINEDGSIDGFDFGPWLGTWRDTCDTDPALVTSIDNFSPGDFDKSCKVNVLDFSIFLANWLELSPQEE